MIDSVKPNYKRTSYIRMRISSLEHEELKIKLKSRGFKSISEFLRYIAFEHNIIIEQKIIETNKIVKEILEKIK